MPVSFSAKAAEDIAYITGFLLYDLDLEPEQVDAIINRIYSKCEYLSTRPMLRRTIEDFPPEYLAWITDDRRYVIYYKRLFTDTIHVIRIQHARRLPLNLLEVENYDEFS